MEYAFYRITGFGLNYVGSCKNLRDRKWQIKGIVKMKDLGPVWQPHGKCVIMARRHIAINTIPWYHQNGGRLAAMVYTSRS